MQSACRLATGGRVVVEGVEEERRGADIQKKGVGRRTASTLEIT